MASMLTAYKKTLNLIDKYSYQLAFALSASGVIGSMVFSEILNFVPCTYCWWQRVAMFPLALILGAAVLYRQKLAYLYSLPLAMVGTVLSAYHSLLQWNIITESADGCSLVGPSCAEPEIQWLGFITIPFLAFLTFGAITFLLARSANHAPVAKPDTKDIKTLLIILSLVLVAGTVFAVIANHYS